MKISKVICDKCQMEIEAGNEVRLDLMKKENDTRGYSLGYKKQKQIDLCQDCYKKIFED